MQNRPFRHTIERFGAEWAYYDAWAFREQSSIDSSVGAVSICWQALAPTPNILQYVLYTYISLECVKTVSIGACAARSPNPSPLDGWMNASKVGCSHSWNDWIHINGNAWFSIRDWFWWICFDWPPLAPYVSLVQVTPRLCPEYISVYSPIASTSILANARRSLFHMNFPPFCIGKSFIWVKI